MRDDAGEAVDLYRQRQGRQTTGGGHGFGAKPVCAQRTSPAAGALALPFHTHFTSETEAIFSLS
jgi:hypothetical protein